MILQSICRPQNTLPLTFYSCENQSRVHLVSLGHPLKPPKHPCLLSMLLACVGLILLQRTFLSMLLIAPCKSNYSFLVVGVYCSESSADMDQQFENTLDQIYNYTDKEILLLGDINRNALDDDHFNHRLLRYNLQPWTEPAYQGNNSPS